ncbi:hypothetical protein LZ32DRAFT_602969 [Colletotrichum eremochloae]|nr:hypothetical protein LZ32DRAFT_602969 [Colletotrichum eremochloae]
MAPASRGGSSITLCLGPAPFLSRPRTSSLCLWGFWDGGTAVVVTQSKESKARKASQSAWQNYARERSKIGTTPALRL